MLYIKTTHLGGTSRHSFPDAYGKTFHWPLPQQGQPGGWITDPRDGALEPHRNGINLAPLHCALQFISTENYLAEADGEVATAHDCSVARRVRLLRRLPDGPEIWHKLGWDYVQDSLAIISRIDEVRPYLQENLAVITEAFAAGDAKSIVALQMQLARFAYDEPAAGLYTGPVKAAKYGTQALLSYLQLHQTQAGYTLADQVKNIAYQVREAAVALATDHVRHRGRADMPPDAFAAWAGVPLVDGQAADCFALQMEESLFRRQNETLLGVWNLSLKP